MTQAKIIEISSSSQKSFEDAIEKAIAEAATTLKNIRSAWVKEQSVVVDNQKIKEFRVILKLSFLLQR